MNSKFYNKKSEESDANIFSKVISGMKSVFNNANKKPKKGTSEDTSSPTTSVKPKADKKKEGIVPAIKIQIDDIQDEEILDNPDTPDVKSEPAVSNVINIMEMQEFLPEQVIINPDDAEEQIPEYAIYTVNPDSPRFNENIIIEEIFERNPDDGSANADMAVITKISESADMVVENVEAHEKQAEQIETFQIIPLEPDVENKMVIDDISNVSNIKLDVVPDELEPSVELSDNGIDVVSLNEHKLDGVVPHDDVSVDLIADETGKPDKDVPIIVIADDTEPDENLTVKPSSQLQDPIIPEESETINGNINPTKDETSPGKKKNKSNQKKKARKKSKSKDRDEVIDSEGEEPLATMEGHKSSKLKSEPNTDESDSVSPNKPRIVLTFRSEKTGLRSTNIKIVTENEKVNDEHISPISRRSLRSKMAPSVFEYTADDNKRELRRKLNVSTAECELQQLESKSTKSGNSDTDDSLRTPPSAKRHRRSKASSVHSDSNSEDSPPTVKDRSMIKRSARRSFKEHGENVLANAIARKEKSYEPSTSGPTRLSRRIKPTAKVLANRELRLGFESQNNARLALVSEHPILQEESKITRSKLKKSPDKCKLSDMLAPKCSVDKNKVKKRLKIDCNYEYKKFSSDDEKSDGRQGRQYFTVDEINQCILGTVLDTDNKSNKKKKNNATDSEDIDLNETEEEKELKRLNKLKKKHLRKLGLKAVSGNNRSVPSMRDREIVTDESTMDSTNTEAVVEHMNARVKSFDFSRQPITTQFNTEEPEGDDLSLEEDLVIDESQMYDNAEENKVYQIHIPETDDLGIKETPMDIDETDEDIIMQQEARMDDELEEEEEEEDDDIICPLPNNKQFYNSTNTEILHTLKSAVKHLGSPSIGESGVIVASQPEGSSSVLACLCTVTSNVFHDPFIVNESEFCRAVDTIGTNTIGCGRPALLKASLSRAGYRAPFFLPCSMHLRRLRLHHCCAGCGLFCTQGQFQQCGDGHLFHLECGLSWKPAAHALLGATLMGCPHCGPSKHVECTTVRLQMKCDQPALLLETPRHQWLSDQTPESNRDRKSSETKSFETIESLIKSLGLDLPILPSEMLPQLKEGITPHGLVDYDDILIKTNGTERPTVDLLTAVCDTEDTVEKIMAAIVAGADPRRPILDADEGTCLHLAAREFNLRALHIFKSLGCQLDTFDKKQRTPLMLSIISYDTKMKELEDSNEALKNATDATTLNLEQFKPERLEEIREAYTQEFFSVLKYLVKAGADVSLKGPEGVSALHLAAKNSDVAACSMLLESHTSTAKAFINQRDDGGWTPLVWAAENKNVHIVRYLLERGADPMVRDTENNVALHWAAVAGCGGSLEALLNHHTPVNVTNIHGDTPLHISARQENYNCVIMLLARGAKLDAVNNVEETPLDCVLEETSNCYSALSINIQLQNIAVSFSKAERIVSNDISNGKESYSVQCVNAVNDENLGNDFTYITENCFTTDVNIDRKITSMESCHCKGRCSQGDPHCSCAAMSVESWYGVDGRLVPHFNFNDPPMIFECNDACSCNKLLCMNRSLSRPRPSALQVFRRRSRGARGCPWAVRALRALPRGSLVCEFTGEVLPSKLAYERKHDSYLMDLQIQDALKENKNEEYCIDAKRYGNVSRFINHKCEPNLMPVKVFVQHRDVRFPRIAFFACRDIQAGEELGYDYGDKFWTLKNRDYICNCGALSCRFNILVTDMDPKEDVNTSLKIDSVAKPNDPVNIESMNVNVSAVSKVNFTDDTAVVEICDDESDGDL